MKPEVIVDQIEGAGSWLPITTVRQAFARREQLASVLLDAVRLRATSAMCRDVQLQRLATFGLFYLAQFRDARLFEPLVKLFEVMDPDVQDEWLFAERLFFFSHRLLAGVCPLDAQRPMELALDTRLHAPARAAGLCAVGLLAAFGDIPRAEAVTRLRTIFLAVRSARDPLLDSCWVRTVLKVHCVEFERELQWFAASGRLDSSCRSVMSGAMKIHPDANFVSILALEPMVDMFVNVFPQDMRDGEAGLLPNGQIPSLDLFGDPDPQPREN